MLTFLGIKLGVFLAFYLSLVACLHLEVPAAANPEPLCIRDFVQADLMVVINLNTNGRINDGQQLNLRITDLAGNEYRKKNDINGQVKVAFTAHESSAIDVCFTNYLENKWSRHTVATEIELDIESGAAARDWNAEQAFEKLVPAEVELRKVKELALEINIKLQYLKKREERMRDTNESTNSRVKWFSILVILTLCALGVWQIQYLRNYFKIKHII